jgi:hypothetical protein
MGNLLTRDHRGTRSADSTRGAEHERAKEGSHEEETAGAAGSTRFEPLVDLSRKVRTSLQSIFGALNLLLNTPLTSEQCEYIRNVSRAAEDFNETVVRTTNVLTELVDTASSRELNPIDCILANVRKTLGMEVAFFSRFVEDQMVFRHLEGDVISFGWQESDEVPFDETIRRRVVEGELPRIIPNAKNDERVNQLQISREADIVSYLGIPLRYFDGRIYGTLCSLSHSFKQQLKERDAKFMQVFARLMAD